MQYLHNLTPNIAHNSPEFLEILRDEIIAPLVTQGAKFQGYSATGTEFTDKDPAGLHTLIFSLPMDKGEEDIQIPSYQDEGTNSFHYYWYGTLYILIPMPF